MIKQKFKDYIFIASKYMFNNISIYKIAAKHFLTKLVGHMHVPTRFNALFFLRFFHTIDDNKGRNHSLFHGILFIV